MKIKKIIILIFGIMIPIISIICFALNTYAENQNVVKNEQTLVNMVASLSIIKDENNEYNVEIIQEQIDKYAGEGRATVTQDSGTIYVTYAKTGNRYIITGNTQYTITYDTNGGTGTFENQTKKHGYRIALSSNECTRLGYTFLGWSTESIAVSVDYQPGEIFMENVNTTLYAVWTEKATIKYDANGGEGAPEIQIKEPGINITLSSTIPTREGYTFLGWATDSTASTAEYQPGEGYTQDVNLELYAVWTENYLTVNYYSNYATESFSGAANTVSSSTNVIVRTHNFYYDNAIPDGLHNYSTSDAGTYLGRTGYTATGKWGTSISGGIQVSEATSFATGQALAEAFGKDITTGNESIDIYAQWKINTYNIIYNPNGGALLADTSGSTSSNLIPYPFTDTTKTNNGITYTDNGNGKITVNGTATAVSAFNVWGSANSLTFPAGTYLMTGCPENDINNVNFCFCNNNTGYQDTGNGKTFTLTADTAISFKIRIGSGTTVSNKVFTPSIQKITNCTYNTEQALDANVFVREGYTFTGWNTKADGSGTTYANKEVVKNLTMTDGATVTLYAIWEANTYTVSYNANGGSGAPASQTKTHGTALTLSSTKPTRTGYTFLGWSTSSTATSATYAAGGSYTANSAATLYAVWKINTYTISYNANGGNRAPASQTKTYNVALTLATGEPTRDGYTFLGWATSSTATTATYQAGGSFTTNANTTLYAVWKINEVVYLSGNTLGGGVTSVVCQGNLNGNTGYPQSSFSSSGITVLGNIASNNTGMGAPYLSPTVDLTGIKTIEFTVTNISGASGGWRPIYLGVSLSPPDGSDNEVAYGTYIAVEPTAGNTYTYSLDVSALTGNYYYIYTTCYGTNGNGYDYTISKIVGKYGEPDNPSALTEYAWGATYNANGAYQDAVISYGVYSAEVTAYINKSIFTLEKVDLSKYSKMTVTYTVDLTTTDYEWNRHFGVVAHSSQSYTYCGTRSDTNATDFGTDYLAAATHDQLAVGTYTLTFDISSWTGNKYLGIITGCGKDDCLTISNCTVKLE